MKSVLALATAFIVFLVIPSRSCEASLHLDGVGTKERNATAGAVLPVIPEMMQPLCAVSLQTGMATWATRYPRHYQDWQDSVHGRAYLSGNFDAPGCTDCHDDPAVGDIRTPSFRLDVPARCARCHADEQRMGRYKIRADVYATYRADYHGWTIDYYRHHRPFEWRYEPVCSDCHRSHAIYPAKDARSSIAPDNLLETCRRCHPLAEANFAAVTTGHFRIDRETSAAAYYIQAIYRVLIPAVIGSMALYVCLDVTSRAARGLLRTLRSWHRRQQP